MSEKIVLIDGHSIINRAFYGVPDLTNKDGLHTNGIFGFVNILFKILISGLYLFNMSLIYVCFLYWLNSGVLHIYNILFMLTGYILIAVKRRKW